MARQRFPAGIAFPARHSEKKLWVARWWEDVIQKQTALRSGRLRRSGSESGPSQNFRTRRLAMQVLSPERLGSINNGKAHDHLVRPYILAISSRTIADARGFADTQSMLNPEALSVHARRASQSSFRPVDSFVNSRAGRVAKFPQPKT